MLPSLGHYVHIPSMGFLRVMFLIQYSSCSFFVERFQFEIHFALSDGDTIMEICTMDVCLGHTLGWIRMVTLPLLRWETFVQASSFTPACFVY